MKLVLALKQVKQGGVREATAESVFGRRATCLRGWHLSRDCKEATRWPTWGTSTGGVEDRRASGGGTITYRDTRRHGLSPQAKLGPGGIAVLSFHPFLHTRPRPPKDSHHTKESLFPWGHGVVFPTVPLSQPSVAFRCFLSGVDSQLSGALRSKRWKSGPTVKLSNLVSKTGKNSLFPSLIIHLFAFSQGVTVPRAGLASN